LAALLLDPAADALFLRYAFVERTSEQHVFPESVLDDWGHEMGTLSLYDWVFENGVHFPRAEVFGFAPDGAKRQRFLRELDLSGGLVCYAYDQPNCSYAEGSIVEVVLIADPGSDIPRRTIRPHDVTGPLAHAQVTWWSVNATYAMSIDPATLLENMGRGA
jgi:hypothetical protein